jgi:hypothetical protein
MHVYGDAAEPLPESVDALVAELGGWLERILPRVSRKSRAGAAGTKEHTLSLPELQAAFPRELSAYDAIRRFREASKDRADSDGEVAAEEDDDDAVGLSLRPTQALIARSSLLNARTEGMDEVEYGHFTQLRAGATVATPAFARLLHQALRLRVGKWKSEPRLAEQWRAVASGRAFGCFTHIVRTLLIEVVEEANRYLHGGELRLPARAISAGEYRAAAQRLRARRAGGADLVGRDAPDAVVASSATATAAGIRDGPD